MFIFGADQHHLQLHLTGQEKNIERDNRTDMCSESIGRETSFSFVQQAPDCIE